MKIFIADDHPLVRQGIRSHLESEKGLLILGETGDGLSAFEEIQRLHPDIAILDLMMPGLNGTEITRRIKEMSLPTRIIILSLYSDERHVMECLRAGAYGYISKESPPADLVEAINMVSSGQYYLSKELTIRAIQRYVQNVINNESDDLQILTNRERDVLFLMAQGLNNKDISERLTISHRTVEVHRSNLMHKLGLTNQLDLVRFCVERGIIAL